MSNTGARSQGGRARVGIMGGTFDPPHCGHLALADGVARCLGLQCVLFMPAGNPNFKRDRHVTPARQRAEMVRLAIAAHPLFSLDLREVERPGVTYTADTLAEMHAEQPERELHFIIGADSAATLPHWRRASELAALCTFVAVQRPGYDSEHVKRRLAESPVPFSVRFVELETPEVSSTQVRERVARGESVDGMVAREVAEYIETHGLYTDGP